MRRTTKQVEKITQGENKGEAPPVLVKGPSLVETFVTGTAKFISAAVITIVLRYFILASGDLFLRKLVESLPRPSDKTRAHGHAGRTEQEILKYLVTHQLATREFGVPPGCMLHFLKQT